MSNSKSYPSVCLCVRLFLAISYVGVLYYNEKYVFFENDPAAESESSIFTGKYAFLTNLNLVFLTGCLIYSALCSCLIPERSWLHKLNGLLGGASSTMSLFVFALFWSLYAIDRELVYPAVLDAIIPPWHNHALHTTIVPASLVNFCLVSRRDAPAFGTALLSAVCLGLAYIGWIHAIHAMVGVWVYPVLEVLSAPLRAAFIVVCCLTLAPFAGAVHLVKARIDGRLGGRSSAVSMETESRKKI